MSAILDILRGMGLGEQVVTAAAIGLVAMYLFRGKKWAGTVAGLAGQAWFLVMGLTVSLVAAILLNWVDPNPGAFIDDAVTFGEVAIDTISGPVEQWVREVLGA